MRISWDALDRLEWSRRIAAGAPAGAASLQQDWGYGTAMQALGGEVRRAAVEIDGAPAALAQFTVRRLRLGGVTFATAALCARGPVWLNGPDDAAKAEVLRGLRAAPAVFGQPRLLLISPDEAGMSPYAFRAGMRRVMTGYSTAVLNLSQDLATLRAGMRGKWRNRLVAGEKAALEIRTERPKPDRLDWLFAQEEAQRGRLRYAALPPRFVTAFQHAEAARPRLNPRRRSAGSAARDSAVRVFRAARQGETVAAMLFLVHGRAATYHIGWNTAAGREVGAHNVLLWRAMTHFKAAGSAAIDLGGVDTERGAGVARFKLGSGAAPITLSGTFT